MYDCATHLECSRDTSSKKWVKPQLVANLLQQTLHPPLRVWVGLSYELELEGYMLINAVKFAYLNTLIAKGTSLGRES